MATPEMINFMVTHGRGLICTPLLENRCEESEPVHRNSLLLKLENVVLAPHVGSSTNETRQKMSDITVKNLIFALEGKKLLYSV